MEESGRFVPYTKAAMELIGKKAGPPRPPLLPAMKEERKRLEKLLREAKIIE